MNWLVPRCLGFGKRSVEMQTTGSKDIPIYEHRSDVAHDHDLHWFLQYIWFI